MSHVRDLFDCVKSRTPTIANPVMMHRSMTTVHAANVCMWLERDMKFDPQKEEFVDDPEANRYLARPTCSVGVLEAGGGRTGRGPMNRTQRGRKRGGVPTDMDRWRIGRAGRPSVSRSTGSGDPLPRSSANHEGIWPLMWRQIPLA